MNNSGYGIFDILPEDSILFIKNKIDKLEEAYDIAHSKYSEKVPNSGYDRVCKELLKAYEQAADWGDCFTLIKLGIAHGWGYYGLEEKYYIAYSLFNHAMDIAKFEIENSIGPYKGDAYYYLAEANYNIYNLEDYYEHINSKSWYDEAINCWHEAAKLGNLKAQIRYFNHGKDDDEKVYWLKIAAQRGDLEAQDMLARVYAGGHNGVEQNDKESAKWRRKALKGFLKEAEEAVKDGKRTVAFWYLGTYYSGGCLGIKEDLATAKKWYKMAVDTWSPCYEDAKYELSKMK